MTVRIEKNRLIVEIEMQPPTPSKTGKTLVVATTHGNKASEAKVNGKPVTIGLNAFIK
jgi:hypothetical protein